MHPVLRVARTTTVHRIILSTKNKRIQLHLHIHTKTHLHFLGTPNKTNPLPPPRIYLPRAHPTKHKTHQPKYPSRALPNVFPKLRHTASTMVSLVPGLGSRKFAIQVVYLSLASLGLVAANSRLHASFTCYIRNPDNRDQPGAIYNNQLLATRLNHRHELYRVSCMYVNMSPLTRILTVGQ